MNILITHVYSKDNNGDSAILSVLLYQLKEKFPKSKIYVSTMDERRQKDKNFEDAKFISSFFYLAIYRNKSSIIRVVSTISVFVLSLFWVLVYTLTKKQIHLIDKDLEELLVVYAKTDLLIPVGGGYLNGRKGLHSTISLLIILYTMFIGELLHKVIILYSQSIGPFNNRFQKYITVFVLKKTNRILVRENYSMGTLKALGIHANIIYRVSDAAFLFNPTRSSRNSTITKIRIKTKQQIVGITVRKWLDKQKQKKYESHIAKFVHYLVNHGFIVVFIPQVTTENFNDDDRYVARRIKSMLTNLEHVYTIEEKLSLYETKDIFSSIDFVIGTRLHSVIFAFTSGVPAISIEYEYKTAGVMADMGLSQYNLRIQDITCKRLIKIFDKLTMTQKSYLKRVNRNLPLIKKQSRNAIDHIVQAYSYANRKKIAIYTDALTGDGGISRVVLKLANYLQADIITAGFNHNLEKQLLPEVKIINLGNFSIKRFPPLGYLFEAPLRFFFHKKRNYDINIFTGNACLLASRKESKNILFCFSPNRVLYDLRDWTFQKSNVCKKIFFFVYTKILFSLDQKIVKNNFIRIIAQSETVKKRIKKYYGLNSRVIYSPITVSEYQFKKFGDFFLAVSRLTPEKRMNLIIEAFKATKDKRLIIVGNGPEKNKLKKLIDHSKNIKILDRVNDARLKQLYADCLATVYMPMHEDFGLVPLESMASGKPCIAVNEGGCKETVLDEMTGYLINPRKKALINAVRDFTISDAEKMKNDCLTWVKKFDTQEVFRLWNLELR